MTKLTFKGYDLAIFIVGQSIHVTIVPHNHKILPGLVLTDDDLANFIKTTFINMSAGEIIGVSYSIKIAASGGNCFTPPKFVAIVK